jgi:rare lipoprotein A
MHKRSMFNKTIFTWIVIFCLTQLAACSFISHHFGSTAVDGAPNVNVDVSKIPDAVPKKEPLCSYANRPYVVHGRYYRVLKTAKGYDKVGVASWYGTSFHGKMTSNRETFNLFSMTAASTVLPIPSYVRVTNLENGKQIVVRVNDRGPFDNNRIIDLSYVAAKKLGFAGQGLAKVRVTAIDPDNFDRNQYQKTPAPVYAERKVGPKPVVISENVTSKTKIKPTIISEDSPQKPALVASLGVTATASKTALTTKDVATTTKHNSASTTANNTKLYLQVGAFSNFASAQQLSQRIASLINLQTQINQSMNDDKKATVYRVQIGPLDNSKESSRVKKLLENNGINNVVAINM